jgi:hypothetical protein
MPPHEPPRIHALAHRHHGALSHAGCVRRFRGAAHPSAFSAPKPPYAEWCERVRATMPAWVIDEARERLASYRAEARLRSFIGLLPDDDEESCSIASNESAEVFHQTD